MKNLYDSANEILLYLITFLYISWRIITPVSYEKLMITYRVFIAKFFAIHIFFAL